MLADYRALYGGSIYAVSLTQSLGSYTVSTNADEAGVNATGVNTEYAPAILLADEPTGALDSATGRLVMDLFHRLHREQGKTIVLITHSPELAGECQRIVTIKDGRVTGVRRGGGAADAAV